MQEQSLSALANLEDFEEEDDKAEGNSEKILVTINLKRL